MNDRAEKNPHAGHWERIRNRFLESEGAPSFDGWPDHNILELVLSFSRTRGDVNGIAHDLIDHFGTVANVLDASPEELKRVHGVGEKTVALLKMISAICAHYMEQRSDMGDLIQGVDQVEKVMRGKFFKARNEEVWILGLDGKRKMLGIRKVAEGDIQSSNIYVRRVVEEAIGMRATGIYLAHNHISNIALPSQEDWYVLDFLRPIMEGIGIQVYDHLIFVNGELVSLETTEHSGGRRSYQYY